jgi:chemotaxis protein MotB
MIARGVPPERLVAAGYGEYQPLESGTDDTSLQKNRRIELKLTSR